MQFLQAKHFTEQLEWTNSTNKTSGEQQRVAIVVSVKSELIYQ